MERHDGSHASVQAAQDHEGDEADCDHDDQDDEASGCDVKVVVLTDEDKGRQHPTDTRQNAKVVD
jgi:hypothetical protein